MLEGQADSPILFSDLAVLGDKHRLSYSTASPWPHVVIEGLVNPVTISSAESQELARALQIEVQKAPGLVKAESPEVNGQAASAILTSLLTPQFVSFLEELTGIKGLIPDPSYTRAGLHVSPMGAYQAIHRDFRRHPNTGLYHRVNVLVFLNSAWEEKFGGELELWAADMSSCEQRILPLAGRMVIFETTATSFHGIPDPVRCPSGRARLSLASYYYTKEPGPNDKKDLSFILPRRPQDPLTIDFGRFKDIAGMISGMARETLARVRPRK